MAKVSSVLPHLGLVGLGQMGSAMTRRLLDAGYTVSIFDTNVKRLKELAAANAEVRESAAALALAADIVMTCLPTPRVFAQVVEQQLLPVLKSGKILVDLGTTELGETRRMAEWLEARTISFLDAPVSGPAHWAREGRLGIFVGGKKEAYKKVLPVLKVLGGLGRITYCGPAGAGQIVKGVEQLALGLSSAAYLEALAYGASFGFDPRQLWEILGKSYLTRSSFEHVMGEVLNEGGEAVSVCFGEMPYFLEPGARNGQLMPMARAIVEFLKDAPPAVIERGHHVPSFWQELNRQRTPAP